MTTQDTCHWRSKVSRNCVCVSCIASLILRPDCVNCKWRKAGRGLGTRLEHVLVITTEFVATTSVSCRYSGTKDTMKWGHYEMRTHFQAQRVSILGRASVWLVSLCVDGCYATVYEWPERDFVIYINYQFKLHSVCSQLGAM